MTEELPTRPADDRDTRDPRPAGDRDPRPAGAPAPLPAADASLLALVDRLAALLERSDLLELEVDAGGTGIILRKATAPTSSAPAAQAPPSDGAAAPRTTGAGAASRAAGQTGSASADPAPRAHATVLAPLTGIFYASPSPGSPPFVEAGREVVVGQVIGLIEAMKLFNEIKSDTAGRVVRVVPENGTLVKAKHPLIEVEPL
ncbi:MAG TPA: biotin/lipoyl-containing protein [Patescibacteria group bacterium]|nr:biotin/lipoyl-containing protein [Patescibacteria group bacterium]